MMLFPTYYTIGHNAAHQGRITLLCACRVLPNVFARLDQSTATERSLQKIAVYPLRTDVMVLEPCSLGGVNIRIFKPL